MPLRDKMSDAPVRRHAHEDELILYLTSHLPEQSMAEWDAHFAQCDSCEQSLKEMIEFVSQRPMVPKQRDRMDRRSEPRYASHDAAVLRTIIPFSKERHYVTLLDVSRNGAKILTPKALPVGSLVRIGTSSAVMLGEVRHCTPSPEGFHAGVQFRGFYMRDPLKDGKEAQ